MGCGEGAAVGRSVGSGVGAEVGAEDGDGVGAGDGCGVGRGDGSGVGVNVGEVTSTPSTVTSSMLVMKPGSPSTIPLRKMSSSFVENAEVLLPRSLRTTRLRTFMRAR